jgi:hypothetical protein
MRKEGEEGLSGQEHEVEGEVMQADAMPLRKDGRCGSGGDAIFIITTFSLTLPERRKK